MLDSSATIGGTWAEHRLYPGLKSNNMLGTYEYPDFPMDTETFGVQPGQHIPGTVIHKYLTAYAQKFDIFDKIRFNHKVEAAEHQEGGGWVLTAKDVNTGADVKLFAKKLVVATGLTSEAFLPHFEGQEQFGAPVFHGKDFLQHADTLKTAHSVTVFGGTKTAWDLVYQYATKGIEVNWVIRGKLNTKHLFSSHLTNSHRNRSRPRLDGSPLRDSSQEMARKARPHAYAHLVQPLHLGRRGRLRDHPQLLPRQRYRPCHHQ